MYGRWDGRRWDGGDGRTKDGRTKNGRTMTLGRKTLGQKTLGRKTLGVGSLNGRTEPHLLEYLIYDCYFLSKHENCSGEFLPCHLFYSLTHFKFYLFFVFNNSIG